MAAAGLHLLSVRAFSSCGEQGLLFLAVHELLVAMESPVAERWLSVLRPQRLQHAGPVAVARVLSGMWASPVVVHRLSSCSSQAPEHGRSRCGPRA